MKTENFYMLAKTMYGLEEILADELKELGAQISYEEVSIGRVVVAEELRGTGLGHELMKQSMLCVKAQFGNVDVRLSAQKHLEHYYEKHGFKSTGKEYLEDGIPHVEMLYQS